MAKLLEQLRSYHKKPTLSKLCKTYSKTHLSKTHTAFPQPLSQNIKNCNPLTMKGTRFPLNNLSLTDTQPPTERAPHQECTVKKCEVRRAQCRFFFAYVAEGTINKERHDPSSTVIRLFFFAEVGFVKGQSSYQ